MTDGRAPRSPAAACFDPPVSVHRFTTAAAGWSALEAQAREVAGLDAAGWRAVLDHGGLWIDRHRPTEGGAVPIGAAVAVYAFTRPPDAAPLSAVRLLERQGPVLAVHKPAWLSVQGTRASGRLSLEAQVQRMTGEPGWRAVHRLDRQTSGVVLFAADGPTAGRLHAAFRARAVRKHYLAVVAPPPTADRFTVDGPLVRVAHPRHSRFAVGDGGQAAESRFAVVRRAGDRAWVDARPITGRTHQLRVHLSHAGHPIEGDALYGRGWTGRAARTLLHARSIALDMEGRALAFESPPPADMTATGPRAPSASSEPTSASAD